MKTFTSNFVSIADLKKMIADHNIQDDPQLLIQCFSARAEREFVRTIQSFFRDCFPQATLIGSTSDGVIDQRDVYVDTQHVIAFTQFESTQIRSALIEHGESCQDSYQTGVRIASKLVSERSRALISFADGIHTNGEEYLKGINTVRRELTIAGGLAGDNGHMEKTYIFDKDRISPNGAVAVVLDSDILHVTTDYSFDWIPIGKRMRVTKAVKNRVYEIDGIPAVDIYAKYLGKELALNLPQIGIEFPLILSHEKGPVGRAVLYRHDDDSLTFAGNIEEGTWVRFGVGNIEMILQGGDYHLRHILSLFKQKIESIFIYSCMARRRFLNHYVEKEIEVFSKIAPTAGFFTYGEFFHHNNKAQLLNETMTVLVLSESDRPAQKIGKSALIDKHHFNVNALQAIAHLSNVVSNELETLNSTLESRIKKSTDTIYKQAYFNKLTKLPNRLKLIMDLPKYIGHTLLLINIDDFTLINDFYGHHAGDIVLKELGRLLQTLMLDDNAMTYKLPSDEFAALLPSPKSKCKLKKKIRQYVETIEKAPIDYKDNPIRISVTISAALVNREGTGYANADMTLKLAKHKQKNYLIFKETMMLAKQYEDNLKIANAIRFAIKKSQIIPFFQPIFDLKSMNVSKYECLVRLQQDDGEILNPDEFLSVSKKLKLYPKITEIMIKKAFGFFQNNGLNFTINLAIDDILNGSTKQYIFKQIDDFGIARQLTFEILETQQLENDPEVQRFIRNIKARGVKIAIDDFGSGYANFERIPRSMPTTSK